MDDRIKVHLRKLSSGTHKATITVDGEFYASVEAADPGSARAEALHYAAQIEFDEWGNW